MVSYEGKYTAAYLTVTDAAILVFILTSERNLTHYAFCACG